MVVHTLKNRRFTPYQEYRFFYFSAYDLFVDRGKVNKDYAKNYNLEELLNNTDNTNYIYNGKDWQNFKAAYYSSENDAQTSLEIQDETEQQPADAPEIAAVDVETVEEYRARRTAELRAKGLPEKNIKRTVEKEIKQKLDKGELAQDPAEVFPNQGEDDQDEQEEQEEGEQEEDDSEED